MIMCKKRVPKSFAVGLLLVVLALSLACGGAGNKTGSITLTNPNGGEVWTVGTSQNITWSSANLAAVTLEYSSDDGATYPYVIVAATRASTTYSNSDTTTGSYAWTVPDSISAAVRVKASDARNPAVSDVSDSAFKIRGSLTVTSPNGGESWTAGTTQNVTWMRVGSIANVKLTYSTDGGVTYPNLIIASTDGAAGSYQWTLPDIVTTAMRVRISDVSDSAVSDESDADAAIVQPDSQTAVFDQGTFDEATFE
jgi:hypothetical protein